MLSAPLTAFVDPAELFAARLMRERFHVDFVRTYQFWEAAVARIVTGSLTPHECPWDVELDYFGAPVRIE
jgi:hypothetical protein